MICKYCGKRQSVKYRKNGKVTDYDYCQEYACRMAHADAQGKDRIYYVEGNAKLVPGWNNRLLTLAAMYQNRTNKNMGIDLFAKAL